MTSALETFGTRSAEVPLVEHHFFAFKVERQRWYGIGTEEEAKQFENSQKALRQIIVPERNNGTDQEYKEKNMAYSCAARGIQNYDERIFDDWEFIRHGQIMRISELLFLNDNTTHTFFFPLYNYNEGWYTAFSGYGTAAQARKYLKAAKKRKWIFLNEDYRIIRPEDPASEPTIDLTAELGKIGHGWIDRQKT